MATYTNIFRAPTDEAEAWTAGETGLNGFTDPAPSLRSHVSLADGRLYVWALNTAGDAGAVWDATEEARWHKVSEGTDVPIDPNWLPATFYPLGTTVTTTDPDDGLLHRYIALADHTSGAVFDAAEETANWQDLGAPTGMVGATATTTGAAGEVPTPLTGDQDAVLHGDGTWRPTSGYKGEVADIPALIVAATAEPVVGTWFWVQTGGERKRGAFKQLLKVPVNGSAFSGWYGDLTNPTTIDATTDTIDSTAFDTTVTA